MAKRETNAGEPATEVTETAKAPISITVEANIEGADAEVAVEASQGGKRIFEYTLSGKDAGEFCNMVLRFKDRLEKKAAKSPLASVTRTLGKVL